MAIYGSNFNGTEIPPGIKRKFAARVRLPFSRLYANLQGVAQSTDERDIALAQVDNGRRRLHVEERRTPEGVWYGIYTY